MLPDWLSVGLAITGVLSVAFALLFVIGERYFPAPAARSASAASGEWKRRREIRAYLAAIDEPFLEEVDVDGETPAFYLPERDVAITFDAHAYFRLEAAGRYAVLVEHEMPGFHLGARLPFETPAIDASAGPGSRRAGPSAHRTAAGNRGGDPRSRWGHVGAGGGTRTGPDATGGTRTAAGDESGAMALGDALAVLGVDVDPDTVDGAGADATVAPPDIDPADLRSAYRARIKEAHPDQGGDVEEFERVQDAYATARRTT